MSGGSIATKTGDSGDTGLLYGGRVRKTDVFNRHAHQTPRDIERVFATSQHACEPIERRVRLGTGE